MIRGASYTIDLIFNAEYTTTRVSSMILTIGNYDVCSLADGSIVRTGQHFMCSIPSDVTAVLPVGERSVTLTMNDTTDGVRKSVIATIPIQNTGSQYENENISETANMTLELTYMVNNISADLLITDVTALRAIAAAAAAKDSEDAAKISEDNAKESETNAAQSESDTLGYKNTVQGLHDTVVADAAQVALDRIATGEDAAQTALDRIATGQDAQTATTQAGIATTQAGIATTKASEAAASALIALAAEAPNDFYNISVKIPLTAGSYYTLATAIAAVPLAVKKKGFLLTFESSAYIWDTYQFYGSIDGWAVTSYWTFISRSGTNKIVSVSNFDTIVEAGFYAGSGSATGAPSANFTWLLYFEGSSLSTTSGYQRAVAVSTTHIVMERTKVSSTWGPWRPASLMYFNVTNAIPLTAGQYYTLTTAIAAIPTELRVLGLKITFATSASTWVEYQFSGSSTATWSTLTNWEQGCKNPLFGKTALFNGDSIMYGAGYAGGFAKIITDKNGMTNVNYAESGGSIAYVASNRYCISRHITSMQATADYVILEGGVNDGALDVPTGSISSGYEASLDDTTYCGAFENMLKQAIARYPTAKIGYVFVHRMTVSQPTYNALTIQMLNKWGIPYIDLYNGTLPLGYVASLKSTYTANSDGWHPNELGYRLFYCDKIEEWLKSL